MRLLGWLVGPLGRRLTALGSERARDHASGALRGASGAVGAVGWWATGLDGHLGEAGAWGDTLLGAVHADAESLGTDVSVCAGRLEGVF